MYSLWKDLSVSKKLYSVVGVMALLIAMELFVLFFAMETMSSVRTLVSGEEVWSHSQKNSVHNLYRYALTGDPRHYNSFNDTIKIPLTYGWAREEMFKPEPNYPALHQRLSENGIHPDDVSGLIRLIRYGRNVSYMHQAIIVWKEADIHLEQLKDLSVQLHDMYTRKKFEPEKQKAILAEMDELNDQLSALVNQFSLILGDASRWLERLLIICLILAVLTVESTGLYLTISFSRSLSQSLQELNETALEIGQGNFSKSVPVRSRDELGQLAEAINKMTSDLKKSIGQRVRAENASQTKTLFLANMSHEIRTPLSVILGFTEVLKDNGLDLEKRLQYLEIVERTGKNLMRIINDILDISKVETGHLDIEESSFELSDLFQELDTMLKMKAEVGGNRLTFDVLPDTPSSIFTDRTRLRQILVNLIGNALKFTKNGHVQVKVSFTGSHLHFEVVDNGKGIPA